MFSLNLLDRPSVSIVAYSSCSIAMTLLNKSLMTTFKLNYPNILLLIQNTMGLLLITLAKKIHLITYPGFSVSVARQWLVLSVLFVAMLFTSMKSLDLMSVSAQTVIKNFAIVLTAAGDSFIYGRKLSLGIYCSFAFIIIGGYLSVKGDPWVTLPGLFWTFVNIFITAWYTLTMKFVSDKLGKQIGRYGPSYYNNLLSIPFLLLMSYRELLLFRNDLHKVTPQVTLFLVFMSFVSSYMPFAVFFCIEKTSPTTFSVVGALNKIPIAVFGIFIFKQYPRFVGYIGLSIALLGGIIYAFSTSFSVKKTNAEEKLFNNQCINKRSENNELKVIA